MKDPKSRNEKLVILGVLASLIILIALYFIFCTGPNKQGSNNIAIYTEGISSPIDVYSFELERFIFKDLGEGHNDENILILDQGKIGKIGEILRFESPDWDRTVTITFQKRNQQLVRNVIQNSTGKTMRLYMNIRWQKKIQTSSGWNIAIHRSE